MIADRRNETSTYSLSVPEAAPEPDSDEFIAACLAVNKRSDGAPREASPPTVTSEHILTATSQPRSETVDGTRIRTELKALRKELKGLRTELTHLKDEHGRTITALDEAAERASRDRSELEDAMRTVSDQDSAIEHLHQSIIERDQEIAELQQQALLAEEARAADATAILESLDKYRP